MKKKQYNIGDMLVMSHGDLYRGIICEVDKDEYVIYWTYANQTVKNLGYNRWQINTNIDLGYWKYYPVK